jgi:hypothetical protein
LQFYFVCGIIYGTVVGNNHRIKYFNLKSTHGKNVKGAAKAVLRLTFSRGGKTKKEKQNVSNHNQTVARSWCTLRSPHKKMEP